MTELNASPDNISEQTQSELEQRVTILETAQLDPDFVFKDFWAYARITNEKIRSSKFLDPEWLAALRKRVDAACERVKNYQDERNAAIDRISGIKRKYIEEKITTAKDLIDKDNNKSQNLLRDILPLLKDDWKDAGKELGLSEQELSVKMNKDDHDACWLYWRQVNDQCFIHYREIKQNNFIRLRNELYALADVVNNAEPFDAITAIKEFQKSIKGIVLEKTDWDEVRTELNNLWERADQRFKTFKSQLNQQRLERKKKLNQRLEHWRIRQEANIQKFNDIISRNFDVITKIESHIEKLQRDLTYARNPDFKTKIERWIKEQQDKINDIQKTNRELNQKIAAIEKKIEQVDAGADPYAVRPENNHTQLNESQVETTNNIPHETTSEIISPLNENHETES
jgi:hypothetical protein